MNYAFAPIAMSLQNSRVNLQMVFSEDYVIRFFQIHGPETILSANMMLLTGKKVKRMETMLSGPTDE